MDISNKKNTGFTLVEVLIVVVILVIIISITLVYFNPIKRKAQAQDVQRWSDVRNIAKAVNTHSLDYDMVDCTNLGTELPADDQWRTIGTVAIIDYNDPVNGCIGTWLVNGDANDSCDGNNGTLTDNDPGNVDGNTPPVSVSGKFGSAYDFDGIDDYIVTADTASLDTITDAISISAWVKRGSNQPGWKIIAQRELGTTGSEHYLLGFFGNNFRWFVNTDIERSDTNLGSLVTNNVWTHMVGTYDGAVVKLYINGVEDFSDPSTGSFNPDSSPITIGAGNNALNVTEFFDGAIDEVAIFNVALTEDQIDEIYTGGLNQTDGFCDLRADLVDKGYLVEMPEDPTEGTLDENGEGNSGYYIKRSTKRGIWVKSLYKSDYAEEEIIVVE